MSPPQKQQPPARKTPLHSTPMSLHQVAEDNLRYIRATMESSTLFTGVSGKGYVAAGGSALLAAWFAAQQASDAAWLAVWMVELMVGACLALYMTARKAKMLGSSLWSLSGRKLFMAFLPAMTVGGVLTLAMYLRDAVALLPGIWLCLYGAATMTAGMWSIRIIPLMGMTFVILGALVLVAGAPADLMLAVGLGGVHIIFGLIIWRSYGG